MSADGWRSPQAVAQAAQNGDLAWLTAWAHTQAGDWVTWRDAFGELARQGQENDTAIEALLNLHHAQADAIEQAAQPPEPYAQTLLGHLTSTLRISWMNADPSHHATRMALLARHDRYPDAAGRWGLAQLAHGIVTGQAETEEAGWAAFSTPHQRQAALGRVAVRLAQDLASVATDDDQVPWAHPSNRKTISGRLQSRWIAITNGISACSRLQAWAWLETRDGPWTTPWIMPLQAHPTASLPVEALYPEALLEGPASVRWVRSPKARDQLIQGLERVGAWLPLAAQARLTQAWHAVGTDLPQMRARVRIEQLKRHLPGPPSRPRHRS